MLTATALPHTHQAGIETHTYPSIQRLDTTVMHTQTQETYDRSLMSLSFATFLLAVALFVSSLFLPVFITQTNNDVHGYWVLAMGWLGFFSFQFAWYAAPFAILAVYVSRRSPQLGLLLSVVAILIASEAFLFREIPFGREERVTDYGLGFYLWYLCFYLVSLSTLLRLVAWGRIEEQAPVIKHPVDTATEKTAQERELQMPVAPKVTRVIVPRKEVVTAPKVEKNWKRQSPPPLPRKNIYKKNKPSASVPPPIPKKNIYRHPPPLPKWYRTMPDPPPLPVKSGQEKGLGVAPFLKK